MAEIQMITYSGNDEKYLGKSMTVNNFHDVQSLDSFDINIIDLNNEQIWKNERDSNESVNIINEFKSLSIMINQRKKSKIIVILPQNCVFKYYKKSNSNSYYRQCELKDMLKSLLVNILSKLCNLLGRIDLIYENTVTEIDGHNIKSSFSFINSYRNFLTRSKKSESITSIELNNIIITTLNLQNYVQVIEYLKKIHLLEENEEVPSWMNNYNMFDDDSQLRLIEENKKIIENSRVKIEDAKAALERNNRYKSVLYTSGDQLVSVVFEILQDMIGCDLSSFIDIKKEDFLFEIGDKVFIGEIKGISTNVKSANISQLDVHIQTYLDNHEDKTLDDIVALLIINHQRNKPLAQREDVQIDQINIACRNKSLILETITLLKMFEKYLKKELTREKCIHLLEETQGILKLNDKVS